VDETQSVIDDIQSNAASTRNSSRSIYNFITSDVLESEGAKFAFDEKVLSSKVYQRANAFAHAFSEARIQEIGNNSSVEGLLIEFHQTSFELGIQETGNDIPVEGPITEMPQEGPEERSLVLELSPELSSNDEYGTGPLPSAAHHDQIGDLKLLISTVSMSRNSHFFGRETELSKVHFALRPVADKSRGTLKMCVLFRLGGIGKAQIALEYCYRYKTAYNAIFWLHAENITSLAMSYWSIAH
jgi:hypothetical protein